MQRDQIRVLLVGGIPESLRDTAAYACSLTDLEGVRRGLLAHDYTWRKQKKGQVTLLQRPTKQIFDDVRHWPRSTDYRGR